MIGTERILNREDTGMIRLNPCPSVSIRAKIKITNKNKKE